MTNYRCGSIASPTVSLQKTRPSPATFREQLGRELFKDLAGKQLVEDALEIQRAFSLDRTWHEASPLANPGRVRAWHDAGQLDEKRRAALRAAVQRLRAIAERYRDSKESGEKELHRIAAWVVSLWRGENARLLETGR